MSAQEQYAAAQTRFEEASARYEELKALLSASPTPELSQRADAAYEQATVAHAALTSAHAAWEAETSAPQIAVDPISQVPLSATAGSGLSEEPTGSDRDDAFDSSPIETSSSRAIGTPVILRRGTSVRLISQPPASAGGVVLGRAALQPSAQSRKPEITRNRKVAGNLPSWSPVPPGEIPTLGLRRRS